MRGSNALSAHSAAHICPLVSPKYSLWSNCYFWLASAQTDPYCRSKSVLFLFQCFDITCRHCTNYI